MNKTTLTVFVSIISIVAIGTAILPVAYANSEHEQMPGMNMNMKKPAATETVSLGKIYSGHLPMVSQFIDKAIEAIEAGNKETALAELYKAQRMLAAIKNGIGKLVKPKFANVRCPIMGSPINPDKVAKNLIRDYKGQKIALCCGGCPGQWDKLTDAEKGAKLAKVKPKPVEDPSKHKMP